MLEETTKELGSSVKMELEVPTELQAEMEQPAPQELKPETKNVAYSWSPESEIKISGKQFGAMNAALRRVAGTAKLFSIFDMSNPTDELILLSEALKSCEDVLEQMKKDGIAQEMKEPKRK